MVKLTAVRGVVAVAKLPKLAQRQERPLVIAFDEFQEIRGFDGARLETGRHLRRAHRLAQP